jgi:hypothetical protein
MNGKLAANRDQISIKCVEFVNLAGEVAPDERNA